jgi:uncharacterized membrane protein
MSIGPIEFVAVKFPGNRFSGEIISALNALVDSGTIRIVDLLFATKNEAGEMHVLELADLDSESLAALDPLVEDVLGLFSEEDVHRLATTLDNGSSAGFMLFENVWATRFSEAVANARGEVILHEHLPRAVVEHLLAPVAEPVHAA